MEKDFLEIAEKLRDVKSILAVYLFGSHAEGNTHENSDIDICIIGKLSEKEKTKATAAFPNEKFDVSFFDELPIWIKFRVLKEGKLLFVRSKEILEKICFSTLKEYFSFLPVLDKMIQMRFGKCMTCRE